MGSFCISIDDVRSAADRIRPFVVRTPVSPCESLSKRFKCEVHLKLESLQAVGAFKARGAMNAVLLLDEADSKRGVVTHSSGNHAAALARAASIRDIPAYVVMPSNSAENKIRAVQAFGVDPVFCEPTAESRAETAESLRLQTGARLVHPYDDPAVMAGQGTVGLELIEQLNQVDTIIVPVGGGGLLSGVLTAVKSVRPEICVVAAEPEWADDAARSLQSGQIEQPARYDTVADGLRTPLGKYTFPIIRELVDDIVLVSESSILSATRTLAQAARLVAEPSGAVTLAALATACEQFAGRSVALVVSGGNLDFSQFDLGKLSSES